MEKVRIRLENISKSYYSETAVTQALRKIHLSFSVGEFVAITGESGSGKSTLLNIIGGMDSFDDGELFVDGHPTFQYDDNDWEEYRRTKIGYVFQDYSLIGHYTVLDNVLSALLIMGYEKDEAGTIALDYLKQVGLKGYETHKANELSSGQKQRLSIARALAKNTGIIVADEPTGNLDSETGEQIIRLLKELSKDRLVIMVTHNYDQAERYVTRKIRIHDGEVVSDILVRKDEVDTEKAGQTEQNTQENGAAETAERTEADGGRRNVKKVSLACFFAVRNCKTLPGRAILFTAFFVMVCMVSFLFIGQLLMNGEDIFTKQYSQKGFYHMDDTRLVVKKEDGSAFAKEDIDRMGAVKYVATVDTCDFAQDINFYIEEGRDYEYIYGTQRRGKKVTQTQKLSLLNEDHFMMSTDCITQEDLVSGRLPEARNEIVLYAEEASLIGQELLCYFTAGNIWDSGEYYQTKLVVTGILAEETEQVYFTGELCRMLSMHMDSGVYRLYYEYDFSKKDYERKPEVIPVIADDLTGNNVRVSHKFENPVVGTVLFHFQDRDMEGNLSEESLEVEVNVLAETNQSTCDFMEMSEEFFDTYYAKESYQASVYITSYAKTDEVIGALADRGYVAMSTYRTSVTDYLDTLVYERLLLIGISVGVLVALLFAEVLILRSLMKIRMKDYHVLKFIGMEMQVIKKIGYFELAIYCVAAMVITVAVMWGLRLAQIGFLCDMMWYYDLGAYVIFILYNLILAVLTVTAFNHLLKGRLKA